MYDYISSLKFTINKERLKLAIVNIETINVKFKIPPSNISQ